MCRSDSDASSLGAIGPLVSRHAQWAIEQPIRRPTQEDGQINPDEGAARRYTMSVEQVSDALSQVKRLLDQRPVSGEDPATTTHQPQATIDERSDDSDWDIPVFRPTTGHVAATTTTISVQHVERSEQDRHPQGRPEITHRAVAEVAPPVYEGNTAIGDPRVVSVSNEVIPRADTALKIPIPKIERASEKQIAEYSTVIEPLGEWAATIIRSMYAGLLGTVPSWYVCHFR